MNSDSIPLDVTPENAPTHVARVRCQDGCLIFMSAVTLGEIKRWSEFMQGEPVLDSDAAKAIGAEAVLGTPAALARLRSGLNELPRNFNSRKLRLV